jgi:hypothetical protein
MTSRDIDGNRENESENKTLIVCFLMGDIWMDGWKKTKQSMEGRMIGWMEGRMDGWMEGRMDGWMGGVLKNIKIGDYILYAKKNYEGKKRKLYPKQK